MLLHPSVNRFWLPLNIFLAVLLYTCYGHAAVLPEDRSDVLYHSYSGGGMDISGPSVLVRKEFKEKYSVSANYYVDKVSSASIDVLLTASPYNEERNEYSFGVDILENKTTLSTGYTHSEESDYDAQTVYVSISQDFFGDLSNISLGFAQGWDDVMMNGNDTFFEEAERKNFRLGLSQVVSKNMLLGVSLETISDQGFLNNPYRQVRYLVDPTSYEFQPEQYPDTRTSDAVGIRAIYYLPYHAAIKGEYRYFSDSWKIKSNTIALEYRHQFNKQWHLDILLRHYDQDQAEFFSDLFEFENANLHMARDKELSTFKDFTIGFKLKYELKIKTLNAFDRFSVNFAYDYIQFDYENFREVKAEQRGIINPGEEPFYSFNAKVIRFFISAFY